MNHERSLEEINANRHDVLSDPENYRIVAMRFEKDLDSRASQLELKIQHTKTNQSCLLQFTNPIFNGDPFQPYYDSCGLYIMDTAYLKWGSDQRIEVGDWDGEPPLFWAESVNLKEE